MSAIKQALLEYFPELYDETIGRPPIKHSPSSPNTGGKKARVRKNPLPSVVDATDEPPKRKTTTIFHGL